MNTELSQLQVAALTDAHRSTNFGGLVEEQSPLMHGTVWRGAATECDTPYDDTDVQQLAAGGFVDMVGIKPHRTATLTSGGLLELDVLGVTA